MLKLKPFLLTLALSAGMALPAMAQGAPEIGSFETFLNSHPKTAGELQANPNLINDPQWMRNHQGLEEYMSNHPEVRADVHENPGAFVNNGGHWNWSNPGYRTNNRAVGNFDTGYLNEHPEVSQQLARNPGLADNPQYLSAHPGLQGYLNAHPNVHYDLEHHPDRFMSKEDQVNGHPNGTYAAEGYHQGVPPVTYHEAHPGTQAFANEHPFAAEHPQAAKQYYKHHHQ